MRDIPKKPRYAKIDADDLVMVAFQQRLANGVHKKLAEISWMRDIPLSHLVAFAVDNEFGREKPFDWDNKAKPDTPFMNNQYVEEATKLYDFLKKFRYGTGIDTMLICRHDIGISDKEKLILGYRELLNSGMVEEIVPTSSKFRYAKDYRFLRIKKGGVV